MILRAIHPFASKNRRTPPRGRTSPKAFRRAAGFGYVEVLIAIVIMAIALVPAIESLQTSLLQSAAQSQMARDEAWLSTILETTLAQSFALLDAEALRVNSPTTPTAYSDPSSTTNRRLVFLSRYDGDDADGDGNAFTGIDDGLLWVRVALENSPRAFETLTTR